jgi:hypothetical protein
MSAEEEVAATTTPTPSSRSEKEGPVALCGGCPWSTTQEESAPSAVQRQGEEEVRWKVGAQEVKDGRWLSGDSPGQRDIGRSISGQTLGIGDGR